VSHLLNEGNNRATARVSMKRDRNTTLNCAMARSVARKVLQRRRTLTPRSSDSSAVTSAEERNRASSDLHPASGKMLPR
jgi:hypothetical protein